MDRIYTINDINGEPVYVGKTSYTLKERLSSHVSHARNGKTSPIAKWLLENTYTIELVDTFEKDGLFMEKFYIDLFSSWGFNLKNVVSGRYKSELLKDKQFYRTNCHFNKPVINTDTGERYISCSDAERNLGLYPGYIKRRLNGSRKNNTPFEYDN